MLAHSAACVEQGLQSVMGQFDTTAAPGGVVYSCPACALAGLSESALRLHFPLYHSMEMPGPFHDCPICCEEEGYGEAGKGSSSKEEKKNKIKPSPQFRGPFAVHLHK